MARGEKTRNRDLIVLLALGHRRLRGGNSPVVCVYDRRHVDPANTGSRSFSRISSSVGCLTSSGLASGYGLPHQALTQLAEGKRASGAACRCGETLHSSLTPRHTGQLAPVPPSLRAASCPHFDQAARVLRAGRMAPMGIRLSPLGVAVFCLLGVGVIYHLYSGVISNRWAAFRSARARHNASLHTCIFHSYAFFFLLSLKASELKLIHGNK